MTLADFYRSGRHIAEQPHFEWQPAAPRLTRLHESGVPVILCSSKTAAEMLQLQTTLNLQGLPLIAENGAVIQLDVHWEDHPNYPA